MEGVTTSMIYDNIKKQYLIIAGIVLVVIVGLTIFLSGQGSGTLAISAPNKTPSNVDVKVTIHREGTEDQTLSIAPGSTQNVKLKTGSIRVDASAGTLKAVDVVTIVGRKTTTLTTPAGEQRGIQQLASDVKACARLLDNTVYSFDCNNIGYVERHDSNKVGTSISTRLYPKSTFSGLQPYRDGLLGYYVIEDTNASQLQYLDIGNQTIQQLSLTPALRKIIDQGQEPIVTVSQNPSASYFALFFPGKDRAYLFDSITDTQPIELTPPDKTAQLKAKGRAISLSFSNDSLEFYVGNASETEGEGTVIGTGNGSEPEILPSYVYEYSLAGKLTRTISMPDETKDDNVEKLTDNFYVGSKAYAFTFYRYHDNELTPVYNLPDVSSWVRYQNNAYLQVGGTVYAFAPGKNGDFGLHSAYSNNSLTISELFVTTDGVLFTAINKNSGTQQQPLNFYRLLGKGQKVTTASQSDSNNIVPIEPTYQGIPELAYYGPSNDQISNFKYALGNYISASNLNAVNVAITNISVEPHDSTVGTDFANFDIVVNGRTRLKGRLEYFDFTGIQLKISDSNGTQVYDSGVVNPSNGDTTPFDD